MNCERCNEPVSPEDSFCPACGVCIKAERCRMGRIALASILVILVIYPLLRSFFLIFTSISEQRPLDPVLLIEVALLGFLGFLFYRAFEGDGGAKKTISMVVISMGAFRILTMTIVSMVLKNVSLYPEWGFTGLVEGGLGILMLRSTDIEAYIRSKEERKAFEQ